jgi:3alpha(or 20beta)-hydroxysteroid dehydrogenase
MGRLDGKVALVTGGARGTGADIAQLFVDEGATVVIADVLDELGAQTAADLGDAASFCHLDVTDPGGWTDVVDGIVADHGHLDVLVNNAAVLELATIADTSPERAQQIVNINLLGPWLGVRAVTEPMKAAGGGSIVNISSSAGVHGEHGVVIYSATKWGLRGLAKSGSLELGQFGIRINCVCPSGGSMDMVAPYMNQLAERLKAGEEIDFTGSPRRPMGRNITLREIANMTLFLASDESSGCNGGDFVVDAGYTVGHVEPGAPGAAPNKVFRIRE